MLFTIYSRKSNINLITFTLQKLCYVMYKNYELICIPRHISNFYLKYYVFYLKVTYSFGNTKILVYK